MKTLEELKQEFNETVFVDFDNTDYDYPEPINAIYYINNGIQEFTNYVQLQTGEIVEQSSLKTCEEILNSTTSRVYKYSDEDRYTSEGDEYFEIHDSATFEEMNLCDTYNNYGQKSDCEAAGCFAFDNSYIRSEIENAVDEDDYDTYEEYEKALKAQFDEQFEENHSTILAKNYWDGHNFKTLALSNSSFFDNPGLVELEERKQAQILNAYFNKEFAEERTGLKYYKFDNYEFIVSLFTDAVEIATVIVK